MLSRLAGTGAVLGLGGLYIAQDCLYTVDPGHRAVKFNRITGVGQTIVSEGLHFKVPWLEWPIIYDVRQRPFTTSSPSGSKDLQTVNLTVRVLTHPMHNSIAEIAKNIAKSNELDDKVLPSLVQETLKSIGLGSIEVHASYDDCESTHEANLNRPPLP